MILLKRCDTQGCAPAGRTRWQRLGARRCLPAAPRPAASFLEPLTHQPLTNAGPAMLLGGAHRHGVGRGPTSCISARGAQRSDRRGAQLSGQHQKPCARLSTSPPPCLTLLHHVAQRSFLETGLTYTVSQPDTCEESVGAPLHTAPAASAQPLHIHTRFTPRFTGSHNTRRAGWAGAALQQARRHAPAAHHARAHTLPTHCSPPCLRPPPAACPSLVQRGVSCCSVCLLFVVVWIVPGSSACPPLPWLAGCCERRGGQQGFSRPVPSDTRHLRAPAAAAAGSKQEGPLTT